MTDEKQIAQDIDVNLSQKRRIEWHNGLSVMADIMKIPKEKMHWMFSYVCTEKDTLLFDYLQKWKKTKILRDGRYLVAIGIDFLQTEQDFVKQ